MNENIAVKEKSKRKVYLKETGNFLLIYPIMLYGDKEVNVNEQPDRNGKNNKNIRRNIEEERVYKEFIASTHPGFSANTFQDYFHIHADKVLDKFWFIEFYEKCKKEKIEVFGIDKLKNIKYYPARPKINYGLKSNTNWFDIDVDIKYDDFKVSLKDIRKAILKKQDYVKLGNDKLAMLPNEWLKKFSAAMQYGKIENNSLRLQKSQFALLDELYKEINILELQKELVDKKRLLNKKRKPVAVKLPQNVAADLRKYQQQGLNWLALLYNLKLGGCLADDMGLGKTLQIISLFAWTKQKEKRKKMTNLVVCPTTLLGNWKNELEKFVPDFKCLVHWGTDRERNTKEWKNFDVVITSYGTLTNDIEWIRGYKFNTAVLDESQAIKNPASLRFKAVGLIAAKQRYVVSGTPIENNTVELFSQMHFINPGMLGSLNSFRKEFGNSIDNQRDGYKIEQLRTLIKPFILRRNKQEVAPELPEKTEQVFYCEMGDEQRKVYETFRDSIRKNIISNIQSEGIKKNQFTILQGLTKLRQICDSPMLLGDEADYGDDSVKADELVNVISSKVGKHKCLVFSQFLGMLSLIENKLQENGIKLTKLTGSTHNRQEIVEEFESDNECRVFLISLKAGGAGLNLVSADYVFLVDPWWNPAVERQAIDRAHRIGQTKKVFAYRMICKDTIEEKIIDLQKQKETLAEELINSEKGFISKLTKDDVEMLLS